MHVWPQNTNTQNMKMTPENGPLTSVSIKIALHKTRVTRLPKWKEGEEHLPSTLTSQPPYMCPSCPIHFRVSHHHQNSHDKTFDVMIHVTYLGVANVICLMCYYDIYILKFLHHWPLSCFGTMKKCYVKFIQKPHNVRWVLNNHSFPILD